MTPTRLAALSAVAALALALAGATGAAAACPAFSGPASWLERLAAARQGVKGPPSGAELIEFFKRENIPPFHVQPSTGPAPLRVRPKWLFFPVEKPVRIEFDADGDGNAEWTETTYGVERTDHTYLRPGRYDFTVRIHEAGGRVTSLSAPVEVFSQAQFERDLDTRWNDLKDALRRGDIAGALDCVHSHARRKYEGVFRALTGALDVDTTLTSIRFVEHHSGIAIYEMLRSREGRTLSYEVRFVIDDDGVWRLYSM